MRNGGGCERGADWAISSCGFVTYNVTRLSDSYHSKKSYLGSLFGRRFVLYKLRLNNERISHLSERSTLKRNSTNESYYRKLLREGSAKKLQELADLGLRDRAPSEVKRYAEEAQSILRDLAELEEKIRDASDGPGSQDYSGHTEINTAVVHFLSQVERPASESEITKVLIRGRFPEYRNKHKMAIRVGRCIRSYTVGKPSENPKLKVKNDLVGLASWPDKMFIEAKH